ncbi:MAG TPA: thioesterase domain-containing protein [Chitinophagaceae bacterium]|nr:thioesterase domain-containing protein [Chitinophagaceae bacterium]
MKINLFCFPFAGGSVYSYAKYNGVAPRNIKLIPLELPGRGKRIIEPLLTDIHSMADDLYRIIKPMLNEPYAFYGHSMGTVLSYLITRRLISEGQSGPLYLFMSGRFGPSAKDPDPFNHNLPKNEFRAKLKEIGGSPDEFLADDTLMDFFDPILRADFRAIEEYQYQPTEPFDIPMVIMVGKEEKVTPETAMAWQVETTKPIDIRWFNGKHFFILDYPSEIMRIIGQKLQTVTIR